MRLLGLRRRFLSLVGLGRSQRPPGIGKHTRKAIPDTEEGILVEVSRMVDFVRHFAGEPLIIDFAQHIVEECPSHDTKCEFKKLHEFVRDHVRFVNDSFGKEVLSTPLRMLRKISKNPSNMASGDCDDMSTLMATLVAAVGIEPRFRFGGNKSQGIHHVWVQGFVKGKWVDSDPTEKKFKVGQTHDFPMYKVQHIF